MKKKSETCQRWINEAYEAFANEGPEFSLKALSQKAGLPRATLYYHFDSKDHLIEELLKRHQQYFDAFQSDVKSKLKQLIPDLYEIMIDYKLGVRFHQQLIKNRHIDLYNCAYCCGNISSIKILLPYIKEYFGFNTSDAEVITFYNTLTDSWYSRIDTENLSVEEMTSTALFLMDNMLSVINSSRNVHAPLSSN